MISKHLAWKIQLEWWGSMVCDMLFINCQLCLLLLFPPIHVLTIVWQHANIAEETPQTCPKCIATTSIQISQAHPEHVPRSSLKSAQQNVYGICTNLKKYRTRKSNKADSSMLYSRNHWALGNTKRMGYLKHAFSCSPLSGLVISRILQTIYCLKNIS